MSGFGNLPQSSSFSGFGSGNTNNNNAPFGATPPHNQNAAFPPQPFGNVVATPQQQQQPMHAPFGRVAQSPMAQQTMGFGQAQHVAQTASFGGFGGQQPTMTFGKSPNVAVPPAPASTSFGGVGSTTSFGSSSTTAGGPFGGVPAPSSNAGPFGAPPAAAPSFGPFGSPPTVIPPATSGPFGGTSGGGSAGPFGTSGPFSNTTSPGPSLTFGASKTMAGSPPATGVSNPGPFGGPNTNAGPFAPQPSSSGFTAQQPFGDPGSSFDTGKAPGNGSSYPFGKKKRTPLPKPAITPFGPPAASASNDASDDGMDDVDASADKALAEMKAKIAAKREKMRKLEERKKKAKSDGEDNNDDDRKHAPVANPFAPRANPSRSRRSPSPVPPTRSQLPRDLQSAPPPSTTSSSYPVPSTDRENLEDAVALVGLCQHMCPDEEMMRREAESDIQLLERPETTSIHPPDWTLRDTMIKRFRRSAADFKLDVPEWVRPPDVLERVCGYLEEWIMDRDRQGPDPRFKNSTPLPLDVYQFVWDRTRMVRKDFILQNYVGGARGLCDARAVRCHERIARWHCMCEHQLSHIEEFVTKQSQQNIQELGQTIKSLNQFYDDTLDRALIEVPDADGNETRTDLTDFSHGCKVNAVQGKDPIDYDDSPTANADDRRASRRLIGVVSEPHRGTAEPEMRGLYILQTMNNDGGMEVRKFVSNLSQKKPEVFRSYPVQLAMAIFKVGAILFSFSILTFFLQATKAYNYIKFFSILRNDATPYLFSCLMFKHVQFMRRAAIRIFSRTYGGRGPDGKVMADDYPLKRLRVLLCFEDEEEAFLACKHFNITVTKRTDKKGKKLFVILWRQTEFKEPIDATKGTVVPLQPRKMIKTIEKKLHGATRLAVCRGQVSGKGAFLAPRQIARMSQRLQQPNTGTQQASPSQLRALAAAEVRTQDKLSRRIEEEDRKAEEKAERMAAEEDKKRKSKEKEEARRRVEEEQQAKLAAEKEKLDEEKQHRQQIKEQEDEKLRIEAESRAKAAAVEKARQDEQREVEAERERLARIEEEERKEEERKRAHIENLRKQEEEAKLQREREAEHERLQAEKKRNEELIAKAEQRKRADEERRVRLDEERKKKLEIFKRVTEAKRKLSFYLVLSKTRYVRPKRSATRYVPTSPRRPWLESYQQNSIRNELAITLRSSHSKTSKHFRTSLVDHFVQAFLGEHPPTSNNIDCPTLLRIGIFYHPAEVEADQEYLGAAHHWISSRIDFNKVVHCHPLLRIVFFDGLLQPKPNICNGALLISPYGRPMGEADIENQLGPLFVSLPGDIPAAVLKLRERPSNSPKPSAIREAPIFENKLLDVASFDVALEDCMGALAKKASQQSQPEVERISAARFYYECARRAVWHNGTNDDEDNLLLFAIHATVEKAIDHVHTICQKLVLDEMAWPPTEFSERGLVRDYFSFGEHLPDNWLNLSMSKSVKADISAFSILLDGSLRTTLDLMTADAPISIREQVLDLLDRRMFRGAVEKALLWRVDRDEERDSCSHIYLPSGSMKKVLDVALGHLHEDSSAQHEHLTNDIEANELDYYQTAPDVSDFTEEITLPPGQPLVSEAPKKRIRYAAPGKQGNPKSQTRGRPSKKAKQEAMSKRVKAGAQFSRQLEELVNGGTVNMLVGMDGCTLKGLLDRAPKIQSDF